jgi:hypothetical protein
MARVFAALDLFALVISTYQKGTKARRPVLLEAIIMNNTNKMMKRLKKRKDNI